MPSGSVAAIESSRSVARMPLTGSVAGAFFGAGQSREDAGRVGLTHGAQRLQLACDLLPHRRERLVAQRCQASIRRFERDDRRLHVAVQREAALCELQQEQRFGARPGALRPFGAAAQFFDRRAPAPAPACGTSSARRGDGRARARPARSRFAWLLRSARSSSRSASAARAASLAAIETVARRVDAQQRIDRRRERQHGHRRRQSTVRVRTPRSRRFGRGIPKQG